MRVPLRLRVVGLVTVFNLAVFGGGLLWVSSRIQSEREQQADTDQALVIERLQGLLERGGKDVVREVLAWPHWSLFEDAQVAQLQAPNPAWRLGLNEDLERVARQGEIEFLPRGKIVPLRPVHRRQPYYEFPPKAWDGAFPIPGTPFTHPLCLPEVAEVVRERTRIWTPVVEKRKRGPVWGSVFLPRRFLWPWELPNQLVFYGLPASKQQHYDPIIDRSRYLRRAMRTVAQDGREREIEGGALVPMSGENGVWGAAFLPFREIVPANLWPTSWAHGEFRGWLWPWYVFENAAIYGLPEHGFGPPPVDVTGLRLNPLGSSQRPSVFDQTALFADLQAAALAGEAQITDRGIVVPLRMVSGDLWGGVWLKPPPMPGTRELLVELVPWFLATTILLTLATFIGMYTLVLDPVRRLGRGAHKLSRGELGVRVEEVGRRDELADLMRSFNLMAQEVESFNSRLATEVEVATQQARDAEATAMTQRRLAATGELAAGIAHEINNPLGGMLNLIEALDAESLDPDRRAEYLALLRGGLERIRSTSQGVLRLAPRDTNTEPVLLADPVGDALGLVRHRARGMGVEIRLEGAGGQRGVDVPGALEPWRELPPVLGQSNELGQAVLNLLGNALDALEEHGGGELCLGLDVKDGEMHLWVQDNGPGMDPDLLPRAADLFFTTKDVGRGTGLGLAIVHNVIDGHGGKVQLSNLAGGGFQALVTLPLEGEART